MLDSVSIGMVTPLQKNKYQMMEDGANFNIRWTKCWTVLDACMWAKNRKTHISIDLRDFCGPMYFLSSWRLAWECHLSKFNCVYFHKKKMYCFDKRWIMTYVALMIEIFRFLFLDKMMVCNVKDFKWIDQLLWIEKSNLRIFKSIQVGTF